jgi:hypothetical protein
MELRISGADQLGNLSKRLRAAGEDGKGLRKELYRGIQRTTKPLKADARQAATQQLPSRGGLAAQVAKSKLSTRTRGGGRNVGVRIVANGDAARSTDRGVVAHPVFGNRGVWVRQVVLPGWFTDTMRAGAPAVRKELLQAMSIVARQVTRG